MSALQELTALPGRRDNPYVGRWKKDGGRVVGFVCGYVPEEIIHAAGLLPYRLEARGQTETSLADVYMHRFNCTFSRCLLQAGLAGEYDFLDGFCLLNGCEQIRRLYEIWEKHLTTDYLFMVTVPHALNDNGFDWYREEVFNFKENLANKFARRCAPADLERSIALYNQSRKLIQELYELRKAEAVPVSGAEAFRILLAAGLMPRERFNELLREALEEIRGRKGTTDYKARLLLGGSAVDDPALVEMIESLGGLVVTDTLCFGSRHFFNPVDEGQDPLEALARRYYYHNPCPRMMGQFDNRLGFTLDLARRARVDGVILNKIVFCDNHAVEGTMLAEELEPQGVPTLVLEREYMLSDAGRLKTRIEAFMERIARR
ncbi:MAG: 2-hydroxyacyl-CoA dehydratase family protein [Thermodesulfobacteriota bacterium]